MYWSYFKKEDCSSWYRTHAERNTRTLAGPVPTGCYRARPSSLSGTDTRNYPDAYRKRAAAITDPKSGTNCSSVTGTKNPLRAGIPALQHVPRWKKGVEAL